MLIEYSKPNVMTLPITSSTGAMERTIMLVPGINEVLATDWKKLEKHPRIVKLMDNGDIAVALASEDTTDAFALSSADIKEAISIVKKTWNLVLLEDWKAGESRAGVVKEINKQILHIEEKTKPEKKAANA